MSTSSLLLSIDVIMLASSSSAVLLFKGETLFFGEFSSWIFFGGADCFRLLWEDFLLEIMEEDADSKGFALVVTGGGLVGDGEVSEISGVVTIVGGLSSSSADELWCNISA